jgi:tetratricopeptide (TPR) repeat protein
MDVLEGLGTLVDQSLVQQREVGGEARFSMLHVIREYALEQLETSDEAEALQRAFLAYLVALVEPVNFRGVRGLQGPYWLTRLECEQDNIRAALAWASARGEVELGLRLAFGATGYWWARGASREGGAWLDQLLALRPADQGLDATLVWAVGWAGAFAGSQGDLERGVALLEQALSGARLIGDASAVAMALSLLGSYVVKMGDIPRGVALLDECLAEARHLDDDVDVMLTSFVVAADNLLLIPGQEGRAVALAAETVVSAQRVGKPYYEVRAHLQLALSALQYGDLVQAEEHALRALRLARDQDLTDDMLVGVERVGLVAGQHGQALKSARLLGAVTSLREEAGIVAYIRWQAAAKAMVAPARAALGEEQWAAAFAAGRALTLEEAAAEALGDVNEGGQLSA